MYKIKKSKKCGFFGNQNGWIITKDGVLVGYTFGYATKMDAIIALNNIKKGW